MRAPAIAKRAAIVMSKSTMTGLETYTALVTMFRKAERARTKILAIYLNHETIADILKSSDGISINVFMGLRNRESMQLLGVPLYAKFHVQPPEVGVLYEKTFEKFNLKDYLPVRPWWERLDTTVGVEGVADG